MSQNFFVKRWFGIVPLLLCFLLSCPFSSANARVIGGTEMMDKDMEENLCALTFDDGPSIFTPHLLDMLKEYNIRATFFMLGRMVDAYKEIALRAAEEGHEIATHTYSHKNLKKLSSARLQEEITRGYEALATLGIIPRFLRPPYGSYDQRVAEIANTYGMDVVLWSMDSLDWKRLPKDYGLIPSVSGYAYAPGEIRGVFLFHDIHKRTVDDFPRIVEELRRAGCDRFVTLSEYMQGVLDPEPPLLMTRRMVKNAPDVTQTANGTGEANTKQPEMQASTPMPQENAHNAQNAVAQAPKPQAQENKEPEKAEESWIKKTFPMFF